MYWSILWNAITGNLTGIVGAILGYFKQLSSDDVAKITVAAGADKDVAIAQLQTTAAIHKDISGMWVTQWLIAAALIPPIVHSGAIFFDSTFKFCSCIPKAPSPYDEREWLMIGSLLGIQGLFGLGLGALKLITRK